MHYKATIIKNLTLKQLDKIRTTHGITGYSQLRYEYPLIFVEQEHEIIFFNMKIALDKVQYRLLFELVKNATMESHNKGLSAIKLFNILECRHTKAETKQNLTEEQRADERIRDIKRRIKNEINSTYDKLRNNSENQAYYFPLGLRDIHQDGNIYFEGEFIIDENSPFNYFEIKSAIKSLFVNNKNKDFKYSTNYIFV